MRRRRSKRKREFLRSPAEGLRLLGVDAAAAENVILTHLHYDHVGNFDLFPARALSSAGRGARVCHRALHGDGVLLLRVRSGRSASRWCGTSTRVAWSSTTATLRLAPGISLHHIGGHTKGLQAVRLWTRVGWVVLASDASHYYANMGEGRPFPVVANVMEMVDGWKKLHTLGG